MEETVSFLSGSLRIEGLFEYNAGKQGVVITHPHPLYGGDMYNYIVETITKAYKSKGYATLRFNFRGAGGSQGAYSEGVGEQEDVKAALAYVRESGKTSIDLAGYSFGAWVNARGLDHFDQAERMIMISPPVNFIDFSFLGYASKIQLVIAGSADDIGPPGMIKGMIQAWNPEARFHIVQGAEHFYWGKTGEIERIIYAFLEDAY